MAADVSVTDARAGRAPTRIEHVGDLTLELLGVFVVERHGPGTISGNDGHAPDDIDPLIRLTEEARSRKA